jgi:hypothetical protein
MREKNSNLEKSSLLESPFIEITYHVQGCITFRLKWARFGLDHGIVCRNEAISDTRVALGMARNAKEADFCFVTWKVFFPFLECRNWVFCEAATETQNRKLEKTPHINNRPPGIRISGLVSFWQPSEVYFEFCASSCRFCWNRGGFAL